MKEDRDDSGREKSGKDDMPDPMTKGMEMARQMMGQMGQGGPGPMNMMQEMMGTMGPGEEGASPPPPMMKMCMGMCAEMLTSIKRTTDMAATATPELHHLFLEWLRSLEDQALQHLKAQNETDLSGLAEGLGISQESAVYLMASLARKGKIRVRLQPAEQTSQ
jgi:hypothetical protein